MAIECEQAVELYRLLVVYHENEDTLKRIPKLLEEVWEEPHALKLDGSVM